MSWVAFARFPLGLDLRQLDAHLNSEGIVHRFTEENGEQFLWLANPDDAPRVQALLDHIAEHGLIPLSERAAPGAEQGKARFDLLWQAHHAPLSLLLVMLGGAGFAIVALNLTALRDLLAFGTPGDIARSGHYWRILTPAFLHFSILHIVFNALWIWEMGKRLEVFLGKVHYIALFLFTAIAANLCQAFVHNGLFGGLSGVVYGYLGCLLVLSRRWQSPLLMMPSGIYVFMLLWLAAGFFGLIDFFIDGSIANWAHLGGLVAGALYGGGVVLLAPAVKK